MKLSSESVYNINVLRGISIFSILFLHAIVLTDQFNNIEILKVVAERLHMGIPFFFLISGYLIPLSWEKVNGNKKKYLLKRLAKIAPLYIIFLNINLGIFWYLENYYLNYEFIRNSPTNESVNAINYIIHLFFLQGFFPNKLHTLLDGSWSIVNEVIFYLIFPLIFSKFKNINGKFKLYCLGLILSMFFVISVPEIYPGYSYYGFLSHFPTFCLGMIAYEISKKDKIQSIIFKNRKYLFILSIIIMIGQIKGDTSLLGVHHFYSVSFFIILTTTLSLKNKYNFFFSKTLEILGKQTYSLYFTHILIIKLWVFYSKMYLNLSFSDALISNIFICTIISFLFSNLIFNKIDLYFVRKMKAYLKLLIEKG